MVISAQYEESFAAGMNLILTSDRTRRCATKRVAAILLVVAARPSCPFPLLIV